MLGSQITESQLFHQNSSYFIQISLIFQTMSLTAILILLNYYIHYVLTLILREMKEMVVASTSKAKVPLSKIDFVLLDVIHQATESIHTHTFNLEIKIT